MECKHLPIVRKGTFAPANKGLLASTDAFTRRAVYGFAVNRVLLDKIKRMDTLQRKKTAEKFLANFINENRGDIAPCLDSSVQAFFLYKLQGTIPIDLGFCDHVVLSLVRKRSPLADKTFTLEVDRKCVASGKPIRTICIGEKTDRCIHTILHKVKPTPSRSPFIRRIPGGSLARP